MKKILILMSLLVLTAPTIMAGELTFSTKELTKWTKGQAFHSVELPGIHLQPIKNPDPAGKIKKGMIIELCSDEEDPEGKNIVYFGYVGKTNTFNEFAYNFKTEKFEESFFTDEQIITVKTMCSQCHPFEYRLKNREDG